MDITSVDYWATGRTSFIHRRALAAKMLAWALVLAAVIVSQNIYVICSIYVSLLAILLATRLPTRAVLALATYPLVFALVFALSQWREAGPAWSLMVLAKTTAAALDTVLLIGTTPYPDIFGFVQRFVPATIGDGLLMAYRSTFVLAEKFQHLLRSIRLRGGLSTRRLLGNLHNIGIALATLLIDSVDYSERLYSVMRLRGYEKRIAAQTPPGRWGPAELALAGSGAALLFISVAYRLMWRTLEPLSWVPLAAAAAMLALQGARSWSR